MVWLLFLLVLVWEVFMVVTCFACLGWLVDCFACVGFVFGLLLIVLVVLFGL